MPGGTGRLFVVGGSFLNTTEFTGPGSIPTYGPELPVPLRFHCMVAINSTTMMIAGGSSDPTDFSRTATYFYDIPSQTFTDGPNLTIVRTPSKYFLTR